MNNFILILLFSITIIETTVFNRKDMDDELEIKKLLKDKREIDVSNSKELFVQIKSSKFQSLNNNVHEIYVIESQIEFYMECQISTESTEDPLVYWWFKPNNSTNQSEIKILKKPTDLSLNLINPKQLGKNIINSSQIKNEKSKVVFVSKIYIDCPTNENQGEYFCAAVDKSLNIYHTSKVKLNVIVPEKEHINDKRKNKPCEMAAYKTLGANNPARIIEYTQVIFNYEFESVLLKCRTEKINTKPIRLYKNPKYGKQKRSYNNKISKSFQEIHFDPIEHIWLDNHNKQIKESNNNFDLMKNGDLVIKNLTYQQRGQFACITRKGNKIDSVSTFIFPVNSFILILNKQSLNIA